MPAKRSTTQAKPFRYVDECQTRSSASLGDLKLGRIRVDCCFRISKTQWGKLRGQDAGLMYLDLTFHQPTDCKLSQATITMNFHEAEHRRRRINTGLEVTEFFGPKILTGEKRERQVSKSFEATPKVGTANASVEGIGISRKTQASYASRWKFTGSRFTDDSDDESYTPNNRYRQLVWHLEENELERQAVHHSIVHTALTFHHDSSPFYLDLQIEVKMQRWHHRVRQRLVCPPRNKKALTRAKIKPVVSATDDPYFSKLVRNIDQVMVEENLHPVAEVSDPKPAAVPDDTLGKDPDTEFSEICLPNEALLELARQLTGNKSPSTLAPPRSSSAASTQTVNSSDSTLVESETISQSDEQAEIKCTSSEAGNPITVDPPKEIIKTTTIPEHASRVALSGARHTSQVLAALIAWLILGLNGLHAGLTRAGRGLEKS
ncbi:hypothetical protein CBS147320_4518 [Aspergillus niger]|uniref:uncharacterized protein n=1 Tax=Aspergillus lacticoffeatus (strain CBS 101883) TaxID=1450533 RepID=UPI000D7F373B|nr:uncharacterized protein BO96DRAFT_458722 [Aspergillus niger CBS 101883]KAI2851305.1 hypothetical protein CBS11350_1209 [Aspergillus niger]KAI2888442.1 hypothetical protein CBS11852_7222 [Aspergillus niger]KAI2928584.1 hypothetical protein CBS147320_4518 [Aspergillus niger]PYH53760.1 hypothetical protein BO96DRAFT_458722 [Aspergillus niger CBS 101883]GJP93504.1 sugar (and other) transporter family protein [Aspergillus niger]